MKTKFWTILAAAVLCTVMFAVGVSAATSGKYTYTISNGEAHITDVDMSISGNITVPSTLGGYPVTWIDEYAFLFCDDITSITLPSTIAIIEEGAFDTCLNLTSINIPSGVTYIGDGAFYHCRSLTQINIPNSVTHIGGSAFNGCSALTSINISANVSFIGDSAFCNCSNLKNISVNSNNPYYTSSNGILFDKQKIKLMCYPSGKTAASYTIPDYVISIEDESFGECKSIEKIVLPNDVVSIGSLSFFNCSNLTSIFIPASVREIKDRAFMWCPNLTIYGYKDSYAQTYATQNGIPFVALARIDAQTPAILVQAQSVACEVDESAALFVAASVTDGILTYQWYESDTADGPFTAIPSATQTAYVPDTSVAGVKYYYVIVTNTNASATGTPTATAQSNVASVTVGSAKNFTISGTIFTSGTTDTVTIELLVGDKVIRTVTVENTTGAGTYSIPGVPAGTYTMRVSKDKHVTREYEVTVGNP